LFVIFHTHRRKQLHFFVVIYHNGAVFHDVW
jgi:hypothetical protein